VLCREAARLARWAKQKSPRKSSVVQATKRVIFRRDGDRYIVFLGDDRIGFVRRADNGTWNHVDTTMAHSGYAKTRERAGQLLRRRYARHGLRGRDLTASLVHYIEAIGF
jgi:hypothetical protein